MKTPSEQILLRVFLRTTDQYHLLPAYQQVVDRARRRKMSGATVLPGILGFGGGGVVHDSGVGISQNLPVIVEIVDGAEAITGFVDEELRKIMNSGIATLERAHVVWWQRGGEAGREEAKLAVAGAIAPLSTVPQFERSDAMQTDGLLLRIFIGESDERGAKGELLYKLIVNKAREVGLKGATVLRGSMGFGANSVLHTAKVLELSSDLPIVIEIVDERAKIESFLPFLEGVVSDGMITMEDVRIVAWRAAKSKS
jgi:PII-like signaling protein